MGRARALRVGKLRMLAPLRERDFAILWCGMAVSLLGDGIYFVAVAWEAYSLSNAPTALSVVGVAWTLPTVAFLLLGGAISDRYERRRVLLIASTAEAIAIGLIGLLAVTGELRLWMLLVLVAFYGAGEAFFNPAFDSIVPGLVPPEDLPSASALEQFIRPLALQLIGPAIGGVLIAVFDPGIAFLVDGGTFVAAALALSLMRRMPLGPVIDSRSALTEIAEGVRFVRANPWLWGTLVAAALSLLAFFGPVLVLLPYLVKNELHAGAGAFGAIRAVGGVGALASAVVIAQRRLPRRCMTFMFGAWALQSLLLVGYAVATRVWTFALVSLVSGVMAATGNVIWGTLMKTLVPDNLLGRVASLDWIVSIGLVPLSLAITGPIAQAFGARATLVVAGALGASTFVVLFAVPGLRDPERAPLGQLN
jgi:DHA3 family tetracycline resistance protein-like MFS transporter